MAYLHHLRALIKKRPYPFLTAALAALFLAWFFFLRGGGVEPQIFTATSGEFVREVSVSGKVVAAKTVDLGFSQGGRIAGVYASVGSRVGQGAVLTNIENGDTRAAVEQKEAVLAKEQANLAALRAGTRPEEVAVAEAQVESDQTALVQVRQELGEKMRAAFTVSDDAVHNAVDQFFANPRSTNLQLIFSTSDPQLSVTLQNDRAAIEATLVSWQVAVNSTADPLTLTSQSRTALEKVMSFLSNAGAALSRAIPNATVSVSAIAGYAADVSAARSSIDTASSALVSAETSQKSAAATLAKDTRSLELAMAGSTAEDVAAQEAQVVAAEADVNAAKANLAKTLVVAPFSGTVTRMDAKTGAQASAGTSLISMIGGTFQVESYVPEIHIASVKLGNSAEVTLDAYGTEVVFTASVASIDPAETVRDGVSTYRTLLQFTKSDPRIRSGMTANVVVTAERRSAVLAIPEGFVTRRGGASYVLLKQGKETVERQVVVGEVSSSGTIEILSGLAAGEVVAAPPR